MIMYVGVECDGCGKSERVEIEEQDRDSTLFIDAALHRVGYSFSSSLADEHDQHFCSVECWAGHVVKRAAQTMEILGGAARDILNLEEGEEND